MLPPPEPAAGSADGSWIPRLRSRRNSSSSFEDRSCDLAGDQRKHGPGNNIGRACRSFLSRWQAHEVVGYGRAVRAGGEVGDVALQFGQGPDVPALGGVR